MPKLATGYATQCCAETCQCSACDRDGVKGSG